MGIGFFLLNETGFPIARGHYRKLVSRLLEDTAGDWCARLSELGCLGSVLSGCTAAAVLRHWGCVGVVLDGNLRDVEGLRDIGFPVFFRDLSPLNAIGRWEMGGHQVPVQIGAVTVCPGDVVFAEFEGIVVVPSDQASAVLEKAEEIVAAEARVRDEVQAGATPIESFHRHGHI